MSAIMPQGELLTRAFKWITETLAEKPQADPHRILDEAGMRFNLSPAEGGQLLRLILHPPDTPQDTQ